MLNPILGKASPKHLLIMPKYYDCFKELEAHLEYNDIFDNFKDTVSNLNLAKNRFTVPVLHSPMTNNKGEIVVIGMLDNEKRKDFISIAKKTIDLALETRHNDKTYVVVHSGENVAYKDLRSIDRDIVKVIFNEDLDILTKYILTIGANVDICIENLCTVVVSEGRAFYRTYGYDKQLIEWVSQYNHPNVGLTLDVCHLLQASRYPSVAVYEEYRFHNFRDGLKNFINSGFLNLVHLANCVNFGLVDLEHGAVFDEANAEDLNILDKCLKELSKKPEVYITLELNEINHTDPINKFKTLNLIQERKLII